MGSGFAGSDSETSAFAFRSPGQVWHATRTGKQMFARHLRAVVREYAGTDAEVEEELRDLRRILAGAGAA